MNTKFEPSAQEKWKLSNAINQLYLGNNIPRKKP